MIEPTTDNSNEKKIRIAASESFFCGKEGVCIILCPWERDDFTLALWLFVRIKVPDNQIS